MSKELEELEKEFEPYSKLLNQIISRAQQIAYLASAARYQTVENDASEIAYHSYKLEMMKAELLGMIAA